MPIVVAEDPQLKGDGEVSVWSTKVRRKGRKAGPGVSRGTKTSKCSFFVVLGWKIWRACNQLLGVFVVS